MYSYTFSGARIDYEQLSISQVHEGDIARRLCQLPRFTGDIPWVVAQHSFFVMKILTLDFIYSDFNLTKTSFLPSQGLLHDCHEYAMGDIPTPMKLALGEKIKEMEVAFDMSIYHHFKVPLPNEEEKRAIKTADVLALILEGEAFSHPLICQGLLSKDYFLYETYLEHIGSVKKEKLNQCKTESFTYANRHLFAHLLQRLKEGEPVWEPLRSKTKQEYQK